MDNTVYRYSPSQQMDYILLQWLERMRHDGELSKVISSGNHAPSSFLSFMGPPRVLWFQLDSLGNLSYACWVEPVMGSVFLSYYAQPAFRRNREVLYFIYDIRDMLFKAGVPVICGLIQERETYDETKAFLKLHSNIGYTYRGALPNFFDGKDCHLVAITKEDWFEPKNPHMIKSQGKWIKDRASKKAPHGG